MSVASSKDSILMSNTREAARAVPPIISALRTKEVLIAAIAV